MNGQPHHWTPGRKEAVVRDVLTGKLTAAEAREKHALSEEELQSWIDRHQRFGQRGLSVTRLQVLR